MISKARFWLLLKRLICDKVSNTVSAVARARQEEKEEALPAVYRLGLAKVNDRKSYIVKVHLGSMAVRPDNKSCLVKLEQTRLVSGEKPEMKSKKTLTPFLLSADTQGSMKTVTE